MTTSNQIPGIRAMVVAACALIALTCATHLHAQTAANCPFNVDQSSAANSRRATTDGLIFIRYALNLPSVNPPVTSATENATLTSAQVATHMATNAAALDIDGDGKFTTFDAQIIARYLVGFRGTTLAGDLAAPEFAKRFGSAAFQQYIDSGCNSANDPSDPRIAVWNAMNAKLALGTTTGINDAKVYMTDTAVDNYTAALTSIVGDLPAIVASYSPIIPRIVSGDYAEYWVSRPLAGSATGEREIFTVVFLRMGDGGWRVEGF
jgi:hypothetical protein